MGNDPLWIVMGAVVIACILGWFLSRHDSSRPSPTQNKDHLGKGVTMWVDDDGG